MPRLRAKEWMRVWHVVLELTALVRSAAVAEHTDCAMKLKVLVEEASRPLQ